MNLTEWYYVAPPCDLHLHFLSLYCTVTFFDGYVWSTTSKLSSEAKSTISEQSVWASSFESSCESLDWCFKSIASLPSISGWVMTNMNKTQNAACYSFVPFSTPFSVMLTSCVSCDRTGELSSYAVIHAIFMCSKVDFPWHFLLPENFITFKRNWLIQRGHIIC